MHCVCSTYIKANLRQSSHICPLIVSIDTYVLYAESAVQPHPRGVNAQPVSVPPLLTASLAAFIVTCTDTPHHS